MHHRLGLRDVSSIANADEATFRRLIDEMEGFRYVMLVGRGFVQ